MKSLSFVQLFETPRTVAYQAPPSMEFPRQECWSGLPFPPPGDLPDPGIKPASLAFQADSSPTALLGKPMLFLTVLGILFGNGLSSVCLFSKWTNVMLLCP